MTLAKEMYDWEKLPIPDSERFPAWLPGTNFGKMKLLSVGKRDDNGEEAQAYYSTKQVMGFMHGLEIQQGYHKTKPDRPLWQVKHLSGNTWGKGTWLICRTDIFKTLKEVFDNLHGRATYTPPRCRRLRVPEPMTTAQIAEYLEVREEELGQ